MGELLRFPGPGARRPAPGDPGAAPDAGSPGEAATGPSRRTPPVTPVADDGTGEPGWAAPGVDGHEVPATPEPTRASRRASNVAMAALTRHDASEGEVRAKLRAKELDEAEVEAEIERLRRVGLLDDHAFAVRQVERLRERKGLGDGAIRSALRMRLVPQDVVDAVLAEAVEDEDDAQDRLQQVADDRARRLGSLDRAVAERRLTAYLMRKGYGGSAVRTAVRGALDGAGIR